MLEKDSVSKEAEQQPGILGSWIKLKHEDSSSAKKLRALFDEMFFVLLFDTSPDPRYVKPGVALFLLPGRFFRFQAESIQGHS